MKQNQIEQSVAPEADPQITGSFLGSALRVTFDTWFHGIIVATPLVLATLYT